jgi:hypothetical protein
MKTREIPKNPNTPVPVRVPQILQRLAALNEKLQKAGLSDKSEYRLIGPFSQNPRRRAVRSQGRDA